MLVDKILLFFEVDPRGYDTIQHKWIVVSVYVFDILTPFLPIIFAAIPWIILLIWHKATKKKITRPIIQKTILISLGLGVLGYFFPDFFIELMGGLAVRSLYGGL